MCTIFYCGAIIFATHGGVGGHQPLALPNTKYVPTHIEVARAGGCSARTNQLAASHRVCAARFPQSGVRNTFPHTHRDRARRRVQPRTHQLAASRRVCVARFRQPVAADSIVDPPAGLLMQLRSQEAPQYLALKNKYVPTHIEVERASGRAPAGAATHTSTRRVPPSVRSAISTARGRAIAINIAIRVQYVRLPYSSTLGQYLLNSAIVPERSPRPPVTFPI